MKNQIKFQFLFSLLLLVLVVSCRSEDDLSIDPPAEASIAPNSTLANLMSRVAMRDGSSDNIIDGASNLSVQLPVTISVNGVIFNVTSEEDFEAILDNIQSSDDDDDNFVISYPITVILSDYSTRVINSDAELNVLAENNENDDDIECIDFEYPITASVFNENTETFETITINNDNQMFDFIENLADFTAVEINFPITMTLADGTILNIDNLQELGDAILAADNTCDEDDDNEFDECGGSDYSAIFFENSILACNQWTVDKLKRNNTNLVDVYEEYIFTFNGDGTILVTENTNTYTGTWSAIETGGNVDVVLDVVGLPDFNDTWNLCLINLQATERKIDLKIGTDRLRFGSYCEENTDASLEDILEDGLWQVASYNEGGNDETSVYAGYEINFNNDGTLFATNGSNTNNGTWSVFANDSKLNLDFSSEAPFQGLNDNNWDVVSVSSTQITVQDITGNNNDLLTLQKI